MSCRPALTANQPSGLAIHRDGAVSDAKKTGPACTGPGIPRKRCLNPYYYFG